MNNLQIKQKEFEELRWLEVILLRHAKETTLSKIVRVEVEPAVAEGDNYASNVARAKIHIILGSGIRAIKSLIIKTLPETLLHMNFVNEYSLFKIETKMYAEILSEMEHLMLEHGDMDEKLWADYIGRKGYNTIIFSDLREMSYCMADRTEMLDKAHGYLVIRSLARFHAMSVILYDKGIVNPGDFRPMFFTSNTKPSNRLIKGGVRMLARVMKECWGKEWLETAERIEKIAENCCDKLAKLRQVDETKLNVLNHGDFWTANILFKYSPCSGHDYPIGIKFVDFQMCHWNSYAFDLVHVFYVAMQPVFRRDHYDKLLAAYHQSLMSTLNFYNYKSEKIPSLQDIHDEMNKISLYGFICLSSIMPITTAKTKNAFDVEKLMADDNGGLEEIIGQNPEIYRCQEYRRKVQPDFKDYIRKGII